MPRAIESISGAVCCPVLRCAALQLQLQLQITSQSSQTRRGSFRACDYVYNTVYCKRYSRDTRLVWLRTGGRGRRCEATVQYKAVAVQSLYCCDRGPHSFPGADEMRGEDTNPQNARHLTAQHKTHTTPVCLRVPYTTVQYRTVSRVKNIRHRRGHERN